MAIPKPHDPGDVGLVFVAHNNHNERCGPPPRLRNTDNPGLYHGYLENRHGEQFVFTFDRVTKAGTVSGGDLSWKYSYSEPQLNLGGLPMTNQDFGGGCRCRGQIVSDDRRCSRCIAGSAGDPLKVAGPAITSRWAASLYTWNGLA
jgi:hypothetical protein